MTNLTMYSDDFERYSDLDLDEKNNLIKKD